MCEKNKPLVNICVPAYNSGNFISKTLDSLVNQTYSNIKIIVVDNASDDNTDEIVSSFKDSRINYHRNDKTIPGYDNWNLCLKLADAEYVALYHADDVYKPAIVERELDMLQGNMSIGAVFSLDYMIDENDSFLGKGIMLPKRIKDSSILNFNQIFPALLENRYSFFVASSVMFRKKIFNDVGYFDLSGKCGEDLGSASDTEFWLRISQKYDIGMLNERLVERRINSMQGSNIYNIGRFSRANHFIVLDSFLKHVSEKKLKPALKQYEYNKFIDDTVIAKNMLKDRRNKEARAHLIRIFTFAKLRTAIRKFGNLKAFVGYIYQLLLSFRKV